MPKLSEFNKRVFEAVDYVCEHRETFYRDQPPNMGFWANKAAVQGIDFSFANLWKICCVPLCFLG